MIRDSLESDLARSWSLHDDGDSAEILSWFLLAMLAAGESMTTSGSWRAYLEGCSVGPVAPEGGGA